MLFVVESRYFRMVGYIDFICKLQRAQITGNLNFQLLSASHTRGYSCTIKPFIIIGAAN